MKFTNINLADGTSGARSGQGLKRVSTYYVTDSHWSIGVNDDGGDLNEDYYVVWNEWPTKAGTLGNFENNVASTPLNDIGISKLLVRCKNGAVTGTLDCAIVRKSDRKAVRIQVSGDDKDHYQDEIDTEGTITAIDPIEGPWSPEIGRLMNMGYIG